MGQENRLYLPHRQADNADNYPEVINIRLNNMIRQIRQFNSKLMHQIRYNVRAIL